MLLQLTQLKSLASASHLLEHHQDYQQSRVNAGVEVLIGGSYAAARILNMVPAFFKDFSFVYRKAQVKKHISGLERRLSG